MPFIKAMNEEWRQRILRLISSSVVTNDREVWPQTDWTVPFVQETEAWGDIGIERQTPTQFRLIPSGPLKAPLAYHLVNLTFFVKSPLNYEIDDPSSRTIDLLLHTYPTVTLQFIECGLPIY